MERNQIRICSDPYRKHINYFWMEEDGKWKDMSKMDNSPLNTKSFISSSISQNAYDVLKVLKEKFMSSAGIEMIFEGTDDDYVHLSFIKKAYYADCDIELRRGERRMKSAKEVMSQIETSFGKLEKYFNDYPDQETEEDLAKYQETVKREIGLCVMGLYSSGKSAFINSLIGQEILPSASDPATAKVYKIRASEKCKIAFMFQGEKYEITFDGIGWGVYKNPNSEIMQAIKSMIDNKKPEQHLYWTLLALNNYAQKEGKERHEELLKCYNLLFDSTESEKDDDEDDDEKSDDEKIGELLEKHRIKELTKEGYLTENKLGDVIEVSVNFQHSYLPLDDEFEFVIYDTPGSNSVMFREHMDILKDSLEQQTNGLPIYVTTPDSMDSTDNQRIIKIIKKMGGALDLSNMMVVVNKSDEKAESELRGKSENKENLLVTKWKANGVYFVSSIMGLGGKKEKSEDKDNWINESYAENFKKNIEGFSNPECEQYKRLFEYNILPEDSKKQIVKRTGKIADTELLIWNSGIPCVEEEIGIFARKYAWYNKCEQAIKHLEEAAKKVEEDIKRARESAEKIHSNIAKQLDEQTKELMEELKGICEDKRKRFTNQFADSVMKNYISFYLDEGRIRNRVELANKSSPGKNDNERLKVFTNNIDHYLQMDMNAYSGQTSQETEKYWRKCAEELRESLIKKVVGSPCLSKEQKELLKEIFLKVVKVPNTHKTLNIANTSAIRNKGKKFLWINRTRIDLKKTKDEYMVSLNFDISEGNKQVTAANERLFEDWISQIKNVLAAKLSDLNPGLRDLSRQLEEKQGIIETKQNQEDFIKNEIHEIDRLLEFEEAQE